MAGQFQKAKSQDWVNASQAARIVGLTRQSIRGLANRKMITTRSLPGIRTLYLVDDLVQLAESAVRPRGLAS